MAKKRKKLESAEERPTPKRRRSRDAAEDAAREVELDAMGVPRNQDGFRCIDCGSRRHKNPRNCNKKVDVLVQCSRCKEYGHSSTKSAECSKIDPGRDADLDAMKIPRAEDDDFRCADCGSRRHLKRVNCKSFVQQPVRCGKCGEYGHARTKAHECLQHSPTVKDQLAREGFWHYQHTLKIGYNLFLTEKKLAPAIETLSVNMARTQLLLALVLNEAVVRKEPRVYTFLKNASELSKLYPLFDSNSAKRDVAMRLLLGDQEGRDSTTQTAAAKNQETRENPQLEGPAYDSWLHELLEKTEPYRWDQQGFHQCAVVAASQLATNITNHLVVQIPLRTKKLVKSQVDFYFEFYGIKCRTTATVNAMIRAIQSKTKLRVPRQLYRRRKEEAVKNAIDKLSQLADDLVALFANVELGAELQITERSFESYYTCLLGLHQRIEALPLVPVKEKTNRSSKSNKRPIKRQQRQKKQKETDRTHRRQTELFSLVPQQDYSRPYLFIDTTILHKLEGMCMEKRSANTCDGSKQDVDRLRRFWGRYFALHKIPKDRFRFQILTDGVAVSVLLSKYVPVRDAEGVQRARQNEDEQKAQGGKKTVIPWNWYTKVPRDFAVAFCNSYVS